MNRKPAWQEKLDEMGEGIRLMQTTDVAEVWEKVKALPVLLSGTSEENELEFKAILLAQDTVAFIIDDGGIVYFTSVVAGESAFFHGTAWEKRVYGRPDLARKTIDYMFTVLKLHRMASLVSEENVMAAQYVEALGFTREGRLREFINARDGERAHALYYGLLRKEFDNGREQQEPSRGGESIGDQSGNGRGGEVDRRESAPVSDGNRSRLGAIRAWAGRVRRALCSRSAE